MLDSLTPPTPFAMVTFPTNPNVGDVYSSGGSSWLWNGTAWVSVNNQSGIFVPVAGNVAMTGPLTLNANATQPLNPVPLQQLVTYNYADNTSFVVNQRSWASGTPLAAGAYGIDRWKAGAGGCTMTRITTGPAQILNITAGSLQQVVEGATLLIAPYTLSWVGTAQGRISATDGGGTYGPSPQRFTVVSGNLFIEFTGGTVSQVHLQLGTQPTQWQPEPIVVEIARCQRFYCYGFSRVDGSNPVAGVVIWGTATVNYPVTMRVGNPTITVQTQSSSNVNLPTGGVGTMNAQAAWMFIQSTTAAGSFSWYVNWTASADL